MPNLQVTDGNYRYNFQGQEKDPETGMEAFELRLWDGRLGRWLTVDPYGQHFSPYLGMGNNPVSRIDPDGGADGEPGDPPIPAILSGNFTYGPQDNISHYYLPEVVVSAVRIPKVQTSNSGIAIGFGAGALEGASTTASTTFSWSTVLAYAASLAPLLAASDTDYRALERRQEEFAMEGAYAPTWSATSSEDIVGDIIRRRNTSGYYIHYTTIEAAYSINKTRKLNANKSNKVYITNALMAPAEAATILFLNQSTHQNRGSAVVIMRLHSYQEASLKSERGSSFELYHNGTLKPDKIIYAGPNPF